MRALSVTVGVLLSIVSAVLAAVAIGLFLDGDSGAGGFAVFLLMGTLLGALLLLRRPPTRSRPGGRPRQEARQADSGFYYGDAAPSYGSTARSEDRWGGDGGADGGHPGHGHGGWSGSDAGADGSSSGSDGGGGSSD